MPQTLKSGVKIADKSVDESVDKSVEKSVEKSVGSAWPTTQPRLRSGSAVSVQTVAYLAPADFAEALR